MEIALQELATRFGLELRGDPATRIAGVCSLSPGRQGRISFLADSKLERQLTATQASAVILRPALAGACRVAALISDNPLLAYARIAALWDRRIVPAPGIHPSAFVSTQVRIDASASIGPHAVVQAGARIGPNAEIGPGCVIGHSVEIGAASRLVANVSVADRVRIGQRVTVEPGAVIGGRGFGLVPDEERWLEVPQLGSVRIGDDVEIGANATVDRGAIEDTVIEDGVKIDSHVHIGHNCRIGAHSVIAGCSAIAGSVTIGRHCVLAGAVGIVDHVTLGDHVVVTARSLVTRDLEDAGMYSSGWGAVPAPEWRRQVASLRRLSDRPARRKKSPAHKKGEGA
ncbi:MAG: UDP-3-O-(3-hydroxymyristoyl)glucosamine N-acyltransferase [Nevskiales bacterium]